MKIISYWASRHRWPARLLLVFCYAVLHGIAFFIGTAFTDLGLNLPFFLLYLLLVPFFYAASTYPKRRQFKTTYRARKMRDGLLAASGFLMMVCLSNQRTLFHTATQHAWSSQTTISYPAATVIETPAKKPLSLKKKMLKKIRENIRTLRSHYKQGSTGERVALIFLSALVAIALLYLVVGLSCSIACNGADGLAVVVLLLGTGLIVFLFVRVIRSLNRKYPRRPNTLPENA